MFLRWQEMCYKAQTCNDFTFDIVVTRRIAHRWNYLFTGTEMRPRQSLRVTSSHALGLPCSRDILDIGKTSPMLFFLLEKTIKVAFSSRFLVRIGKKCKNILKYTCRTHILSRCSFLLYKRLTSTASIRKFIGLFSFHKRMEMRWYGATIRSSQQAK